MSKGTDACMCTASSRGCPWVQAYQICKRKPCRIFLIAWLKLCSQIYNKNHENMLRLKGQEKNTDPL